jgi:hypothetical protein
MIETGAEFPIGPTRDLGAVRGTLERLETRLDHSISAAKWTIGILVPIVISLVGGAFWLTWHAAKLDSRVDRLEHPTRIERPQARR